jgi:hypothetical protein
MSAVTRLAREGEVCLRLTSAILATKSREISWSGFIFKWGCSHFTIITSMWCDFLSSVS